MLWSDSLLTTLTTHTLAMNQFLVEFDLPESFTERFIALIPQQRAKVNQLMRSGKLTNYALSMDRLKLWVFFIANSEAEVMELINEFPLIDMMRPTVHSLMFHENIGFQFPVMSLN